MTRSSLHEAIVYLVQSKGSLSETYHSVTCEGVDLIHLTWGETVEGAIYLPGSTWSQGRNRLLEEAQDRGDYLYFVFLDDDVSFEMGGWRDFEALLRRHRPAIATPYYAAYEVAAACSDLRLEAHSCYYFDAMFNAFHRDVVLDGLLLPYYSGFDARSWWYSQWIVIRLANRFYSRKILQFNTIRINNANHGAYPQGSDFAEVEKWLANEVFGATLLPTAVRSFLKRLIWKLVTPRICLKHQSNPHPPQSPPSSYRLSARVIESSIRAGSSYWEGRKRPELVGKK